MHPNFYIRTIKTSDVLAIIDLENKYLSESIGATMLLNEINNQYAHFFVGVIDDKIIGYLGAWIIEGIAEVINFVIDKDYWGLGYSTYFWQVFEGLSKVYQAKQVLLEVKENNERAIKFYKKCDLVKVGLRKKYYHDDSNAIVMMKVIK